MAHHMASMLKIVDDFAIRSLPPELAEKWADVYSHWIEHSLTMETNRHPQTEDALWSIYELLDARLPTDETEDG